MTMPASNDQNATASAAPVRTGRERKRRPPRPVRVESVTRLAPRLVSVTLGGEGLEDSFRSVAPTSHIKVFLPAEGHDAPALPEFGPDGPIWPPDSAQPVVRTYTPRRFDEATRTLEVQFVLHGEGPASEWAARAQVGDQVAVAGPGGRFQLDPEVTHWWIAGDESALPAIGTLLDALPDSASAEVHVEVAGPEDEILLPSRAQTTVAWHHRRRPDAWGVELLDAANDAPAGNGWRAWVACEAVAVRRIRTRLLEERGVPAGSVVTRGYWRLGAADHPDHDYGDEG